MAARPKTLKQLKLADEIVQRVDGVSSDEDGNVALGAVRATASQTFTTDQQKCARDNIGAIAGGGVTLRGNYSEDDDNTLTLTATFVPA